MRTLRVAVVGMATGLAAAVASPVEPAAAQQVRVASDGAEIAIGGRIQVQGRTSSCSGFPIDEASACQEDVPGVDWFLNRARITLDIRVNDWIEGRIEPDFGDVDEVTLKDAWGGVRLNPHAFLKIGHFKRPFDGFRLTSSTRILTIERGIDIPGVEPLRAVSYDELTTRLNLSDRDVGIQLEGAAAADRFRYWVGAFNGQGPEENGDLNTEKQFVARGQLSTAAGSLPLDLAAAFALTDVPFTHESGELDGAYFGAFEAWAELGAFEPGPHVQAGLTLGENPLQNESGGEPDLEADEAFAPMLAWQVIGAWRFEVAGSFFVEAVEPLLRVTRADPNRDLGDDAVWGFTPGVQVFFDGRNKLALNWDVASFEADGLRSENSFKAQYQLHF